MAKRTGLGKGLGAIFGDEVMESAAEEQEMKNHPKPEQTIIKKETGEEESEAGKGMFLKISSIEPNHNLFQGLRILAPHKIVVSAIQLSHLNQTYDYNDQ